MNRFNLNLMNIPGLSQEILPASVQARVVWLRTARFHNTLNTCSYLSCSRLFSS